MGRRRERRKEDGSEGNRMITPALSSTHLASQRKGHGLGLSSQDTGFLVSLLFFTGRLNPEHTIARCIE